MRIEIAGIEERALHFLHSNTSRGDVGSEGQRPADGGARSEEQQRCSPCGRHRYGAAAGGQGRHRDPWQHQRPALALFAADRADALRTDSAGRTAVWLRGATVCRGGGQQPMAAARGRALPGLRRVPKSVRVGRSEHGAMALQLLRTHYGCRRPQREGIDRGVPGAARCRCAVRGYVRTRARLHVARSCIRMSDSIYDGRAL